jgi:hypothetical protein
MTRLATRPVRLLVGILALLTLLGTLSAARAHEPAMGVLEFREVRPGSYVGGWTLEPTIGGNNVKISFPPACRFDPPALDCGRQGLVGRVTVDNLGANMSAVLLRLVPLGGEPRSYTMTAGRPVISILGAGAPTWETWTEIGLTYLNVGVDHILLGVDHLLFVFGLIFLLQGGWRLVKTITAFTLGHSASLALAAYGVLGVPEAPLNAAIALSIVYLGVEIVHQHQGRPGLTSRYPWAVAFGFGLVHGIGFASALSQLGIERTLLLPALLSFNVGVELGQLAFVLLVLLLMWSHRRLGPLLRPRWQALVPGYTIGTVASFWFIGRVVRLLAV